MVIFISVPIHGRTREQIDDVIRDCIDWWQEKEHHFTDAYITNVDYEPSVPLEVDSTAWRVYCLGTAIQKLGQCDAVIFAPGWDTANGCRVEFEVCNKYDIPCYTLAKVSDFDGDHIKDIDASIYTSPQVTKEV